MGRTPAPGRDSGTAGAQLSEADRIPGDADTSRGLAQRAAGQHREWFDHGLADDFAQCNFVAKR
jgi:hypothetical protein